MRLPPQGICAIWHIRAGHCTSTEQGVANSHRGWEGFLVIITFKNWQRRNEQEFSRWRMWEEGNSCGKNIFTAGNKANYDFVSRHVFETPPPPPPNLSLIRFCPLWSFCPSVHELLAAALLLWVDIKSVDWDFPAGPVVKNLPASAGTQVQSLVWEEPTCLQAPRPRSHNYWSPYAQCLSSTAREASTVRSLCNTAREQPPRCNQRKPMAAVNTQHGQK